MGFKFQLYLGFAFPGFGLCVLASKLQCWGSDHCTGTFLTGTQVILGLLGNLVEAAVPRHEAL